MAWPEFKRLYSGNSSSENRTKSSQEHCIDILIGDAEISHVVWKERWRRWAPRHLREIQLLGSGGYSWGVQTGESTTQSGARSQKESVQVLTGASQTAADDTYLPMPDRIRINGYPLRILLKEVLNIETEGVIERLTVLLKPFKLLVHHQSSIKKLYGDLARRYESHESPGRSDIERNMGDKPQQDKPENQKDDKQIHKDKTEDDGMSPFDKYGTEQAYKELGYLVEFMDNDLRPLKQLKDSSVTKIYFSDLWHIFRPGEEVVTSTARHQAYRVLHATGGRPYLSPPEEE